MRKQLFCLGALICTTALSACTEAEVPPGPVDNRTPVLAEVPPPAISGGTLLVLSDSRVLVADSDRDRAHVVSISPARFDADFVFEQGAEPGRSVEGSDGLVHIVLRGAGDIATVDTNSGEIVERRHVCTDPRGVAFDSASARVFASCSDGTLAAMPERSADGEVERRVVEPDLRDIVIDGDTLLISRLRSAEIVEVSMTGLAVTGRRSLPPVGSAQPTVAWRMVEAAPGQVVMLHQFSATTEIPITAPDEPDRGDPEPPETPYGGGGLCKPPIVSPGVSTWQGTDLTGVRQFGGPSPAVDLAVGSQGQIAFAVAGAPAGATDVVFNDGPEDFCFEGTGGLSTPGQPVAVAYLDDGTLIVQSREPGALYVYSPEREHVLTIELSGKSRFDTGHDLYHRATDASIACASCHPEGTDDGHVWNFEQLGPRRTQSPEVGLEGSAPFHWDGDMTDFQTLSNEVYTHRMGGAMQSDERAAAFERWLFSAKRAPVRAEVDEDLRAEGEALFASYDCTSCHSGTRLTNDKTVAVRGKDLQVPSLRRVAVRPPYMHDGRSADLRAAVLDMLEATKPDADYSGHEVDAIVAYLRTL